MKISDSVCNGLKCKHTLRNVLATTQNTLANTKFCDETLDGAD